MADFTQMFLQGLQAGQAQKASEEDRLQRLEKLKMDKEEATLRAKFTGFQMKKLEQEGAKQQFDFMQGQDAPVGDISQGVSGVQGGGQMDLGAAIAAAQQGQSVPRVDTSSMQPLGQLPQVSMPSMVPGQPDVMARPQTRQQLFGQEQEKQTNKMQMLLAETAAKRTIEKKIDQQFPETYTVPAAEAKLRGLPEYAGREIPKDQWQSIKDAQSDFMRETRADERVSRSLSAESAREERRKGEEARRVFNSIQSQWFAAPGVADAVKGGLANTVFEDIAKVYNDRLASGKSLGEAEEQLLVQRLRNLEPTSVVMPSEFARASGMSPLYQRLANLIPRLTVRGGVVPPALVKDAIETAAAIHNGRVGWLKDQARPFVIRAAEAGIPVEKFTFAPYASSAPADGDPMAKYWK